MHRKLETSLLTGGEATVGVTRNPSLLAPTLSIPGTAFTSFWPRLLPDSAGKKARRWGQNGSVTPRLLSCQVAPLPQIAMNIKKRGYGRPRIHSLPHLSERLKIRTTILLSPSHRRHQRISPSLPVAIASF